MIDTLWMALRLAVAVVLLVAAIPKLRDLPGFAGDLGRYRLVPGPVLRPAAGLVVLAELLAAGLLVAGSPAGFWLAGGLFALFAAAITSALARRLAIPCGCFGGGDVVSRTALARVALLLGASVTGVALGLTGPAPFVSGWDLSMAATLAAGGLVLGRLCLLLPDLRAAMGTPSSTPTRDGASPGGAR